VPGWRPKLVPTLAWSTSESTRRPAHATSRGDLPHKAMRACPRLRRRQHPVRSCPARRLPGVYAAAQRRSTERTRRVTHSRNLQDLSCARGAAPPRRSHGRARLIIVRSMVRTIRSYGTRSGMRFLLPTEGASPQSLCREVVDRPLSAERDRRLATGEEPGVPRARGRRLRERPERGDSLRAIRGAPAGCVLRPLRRADQAVELGVPTEPARVTADLSSVPLGYAPGVPSNRRRPRGHPQPTRRRKRRRPVAATTCAPVRLRALAVA
jgi:hypothetical protein